MRLPARDGDVPTIGGVAPHPPERDPPPVGFTHAAHAFAPVTDDDGSAIGYQVLRRGTPVRSADGAPVGTVRRVLDNAREHIFDGIVIDTPSGRRFVDAPEVARIYERAVVLTITAQEVGALPAAPSAVADRLANARTVRNTRRTMRALGERWKNR